jgi:hypothetical protein
LFKYAIDVFCDIYSEIRVPAMEACRGSEDIAPVILALDPRWRLVSHYPAHPYYHQYPLNRRIGGPCNQFGDFGGEKILYPYKDLNPLPPST